MALFAVGLVAVFGVALAIGRYAVPDQSDRATAPASHSTGHGTGDGDHAATTQAQPVVGTSLTADGYVLTGLRGPDRTGTTGPVSFTITGSDGAPLTRYTPSHTKDLHLIIVRADGAHHAYEQPENDGQPLFPVTCGGRVYLCAPWMLAQATEFIGIVKFMGDLVELSVHGDGLIAGIIRTGAQLAAIAAPQEGE